MTPTAMRGVTRNVGFPPALAAKGYKLVDPGRYQNLTDDFTAQITTFKNAGAQIMTGVMLPPDFTVFWTQARQQGFRPKIVSVGKAILFPVSVEALGAAGHNLSSEVWWTPSHPFRSSLTGQSAGDLARAYTQATGKQWDTANRICPQPVSKWLSMCSSAQPISGKEKPFETRLLQQTSTRSSAMFAGMDRESPRLRPRTSPRHRSWVVNGGTSAMESTIWR